MIMFPGGAISAADLLDTLQKMHRQQMYRQLVFYLDTCHSGSMFQQLPADTGILAISSSTPAQSAWAVYCFAPEDVVQGKEIGACLADEMSISWLLDSEAHHADETLGAQIKSTAAWTKANHCAPGSCSSTVCTYGDKRFLDEPLSWFQGQRSAVRKEPRVPSTGIEARDVKLELLKHRIVNANDAVDEAAFKLELRHELDERDRIDRFFASLKDAACEGRCNATSQGTSAFGCGSARQIDLSCHKALIDTISSPRCSGMTWGDYSGKYAGLLADLCHLRGDLGLTVESLTDIVQSECFEASSLV